jgi:hypothetical protein
MRNYLTYGLAAAVLFAISASVSLWLNNKKKDAGNDSGAAARSDRPNLDDPAVSLREREKTVREKEQALKQRQKTLELLDQDIHAERAAMDELNKQIQKELRDAGRRAAVPSTKYESSFTIGSLRDEEVLKKSLAPQDTTANDNLARLAAHYETLQPEQVAAELQKQAYGGDKVAAVKILSLMKKDAADVVLAVVSSADPTLSVELNSQVRSARTAPTVPTTTALPMEPVPPMVPSLPMQLPVPPRMDTLPPPPFPGKG